MLRSMTAFGEAKEEGEIGFCSVELQSVNRRFLEVSLSLPKELSSFEVRLRKELEKLASRGSISCKVQVALHNAAAYRVSAHLPLAQSLVSSWQSLFAQLNISGYEQSVPSLLLQQESRLLSWEKDADIKPLLEALLLRAVSKASVEFTLMKDNEGKILAEDLLCRVEKIRDIASNIEVNSHKIREENIQKLLIKVQQAFPEESKREEVLLKEVCQIVDKGDITEELVRLLSHVQQFTQEMHESFAQGKKLEFITQEMLREANTIGSKSTDLPTTRQIIEIKTLIEQLRQQIQNVE